MTRGWVWGLAAILAAQSAQAADLVIKVEGLRSQAGVVRMALYDKEEGFPKEDGRIAGAVIPADRQDLAHAFRSLAPGTYAVALYHDENANNKFDFTWIGTPDEGYGFSNGATAQISAPRFREAAITVGHGDGAKEISIKVMYW